ncbi:hypothetical protein ACLOJK_033302 [Asimina triloba]
MTSPDRSSIEMNIPHFTFGWGLSITTAALIPGRVVVLVPLESGWHWHFGSDPKPKAPKMWTFQRVTGDVRLVPIQGSQTFIRSATQLFSKISKYRTKLLAFRESKDQGVS